MNKNKKNKISDLVKNSSDTDRVITLLETNRKFLLSTWVDKVRDEFDVDESTSDTKIADHMLYIIDALIAEFKRYQTDPARYSPEQQGDMDYDEGKIKDEKDGGYIHGRQRASIDAYNADKVFQEYVLLRKVIINFLQYHQVLDINHMEIVSCVIESCSRESLKTFTNSLVEVQSKLLSTIVHDIRSPLNAISMMGELMSMERSPEKRTMFAKKIVSSSSRISAMLEDMLQSLTMEGGKGLDLSFQQHSASELLSAIVVDTHAIFGVRLQLNLPSDNIFAVFDKAVIARVLENLLSNAFKYGSTDTPVTLTLTQTNTNLLIDVHNFGNPIDDCRFTEIFAFLRRFKGREGSSENSWGIGLSFVKAAIEGHGGRISVSSDESLGTSFLINIPKNLALQGRTQTVPI